MIIAPAAGHLASKPRYQHLGGGLGNIPCLPSLVLGLENTLDVLPVGVTLPEVHPLGRVAAGDPLARSLCAFVSIFWGLRLLVQFFVFDVREYLTNWLYKIGYHSLALAFLYQTLVYGYCALRGG